MQPLTEQEKQFAEKNHGLVYSFLHRYKYNADDFYDIVIFGFLKAVQVYHRKEDVKRKYDFAFISWQYMRSEIGNHFRMESALKRKMETATIGLDERYIGTEYDLEDGFIRRESFLEYIQELDKEQRKIISLRMRGYSNKEIYNELGIKSSTYYKNWNRVKYGLNKEGKRLAKHVFN
ncbi:sigma-70 family RNA polymerase sigma factor [Anaerotignum sp.]